MVNIADKFTVKVNPSQIEYLAQQLGNAIHEGTGRVNGPHGIEIEYNYHDDLLDIEVKNKPWYITYDQIQNSVKQYLNAIN